MQELVAGQVRPRTGDLVLARVDRIGHHARLELTTGRRAHLHVGDEIIVAYAHRYAPDQFEAHVPLGLSPTHLVASGGIASEMHSRCGDVRRPTDISPMGLVADYRGVPLNVGAFGLLPCPVPEHTPVTVVVLGTSMNAGKTTTAHRLVRGLAVAGHSPGAAKVTGTGAGGDYWLMIDAGAHAVLDFTDVGLASTYRIEMAALERKAVELIHHLAQAGCGAIVVEVADGVFQQETARLMQSELFRSRIDGVIFAAADAVGAIGGLERLRALELPVVALAGKLTRSPLAVREAAAACDLPVLTLDELGDPATASALFGFSAPPHATPLELEEASCSQEESGPDAHGETEDAREPLSGSAQGVPGGLSGGVA